MVICTNYAVVAEHKLNGLKLGTVGFAFSLLKLCDPSLLKSMNLPAAIDVPAALYLKNLVKSDWQVL
mgnify:CR=1 FL=1